MKFLVLTSLAFVVGQFWIAGKNWMRGREIPPGAKRIAAIASRGRCIARFRLPGTSMIRACWCRTRRQEFVAFGQKCTHLSCAVIPKPEQGVFRCPCHEGFFDIRTGRQLAGPPPRPLSAHSPRDT